MPIPDLNAAVKANDKRLRYKLLYFAKGLCETSPTGWIGGRSLMDETDADMPRGQQFRDDGHALSLLRDLVTYGTLEERHPGFRHRGEIFGLDHCQFKITAEGSLLLEDETQAPHPMINDGRTAWDE